MSLKDQRTERSAKRVRRKRGRKKRGYMLLEQLMAGGLLAATIATTYGVINQARNNIIRSSKRQRAIAVAKAQVEQLMAADHVIVGSTEFEVPNDAAITGRYEVILSNVHNNANEDVGGLRLLDPDQLHEIIVQVRYPDINGEETSLTFRRYRRR